MLRLAAIMLALALAAPTPAGAAVLQSVDSIWSPRIAQVESSVSVPGPAGPPISIVHAGCPGIADADGCSLFEQSEIAMVAFHRDTLEHELGHFFDQRNLDGAERHHMAALLRMPNHGWDDCGSPSGGWIAYGHCPAEKFADAYMACALRMTPGSAWTWSTTYDWYPSVRRNHQVCRAIWRYKDPA